jgi:hypothetical protein
VEDLEDLESRLEEVWIGKVRLKVNKARFGREDQKGDGERRSRVVDGNGGGTATKESTTNNPPFAWDRSQFSELQKEVSCLEVQPSEEMLQYLQGCFVVELNLH